MAQPQKSEPRGHPDRPPKTFDVVLRKWIAEGHSKHDVRKICRVGSSLVDDFVKGRANPTPQQLQRLCGANLIFKHVRLLTDAELRANARPSQVSEPDAQPASQPASKAKTASVTHAIPVTHALTFHAALRSIRTRLRLSLGDIAEWLGTTAGDLLQIEQGRPIPREVYQRIIEVLPSVDAAFAELTGHPRPPAFAATETEPMKPTKQPAADDRRTLLKAIVDRLMIEHGGCVLAKLVEGEANQVGIPSEFVYRYKALWGIQSYRASGSRLAPWYWVSEDYTRKHNLKTFAKGSAEPAPTVVMKPEPTEPEPTEPEPATEPTWTLRLRQAQRAAPLTLPLSRQLPDRYQPIRKITRHCVDQFNARYLAYSGRSFGTRDAVVLIDSLVEAAVRAGTFEIGRNAGGRAYRAVAVASPLRGQANLFVVVPKNDDDASPFSEVVVTVLPRQGLPNTPGFERECVYETVKTGTLAEASSEFHNRIAIPAELVEQINLGEVEKGEVTTGRWQPTPLIDDLEEMGRLLGRAMATVRQRATVISPTTKQLVVIEAELTEGEARLAILQTQLTTLQTQVAMLQTEILTLTARQAELQTQKDQVRTAQTLMHGGVEDVILDIQAIQAWMVKVMRTVPT